ncbi:carbon storage regulator, CsrA [Anaerovirgula multivorans]|uniref:Translational regulator CsrA n=1 Tax=Anaerovirgula multivorans TaxID=312168 RepID=A0A239EX40_9FIRM|nr:carbon storage regulator CsrA [Anaerovirgula multivorans]SNS49147.1 carbon storage regulator, CsrA [Anaerovirgula multivorans]
MLVLARKQEESIMLGKDIEIKILSIEEDRVKIGISAPKNIEIFRKEVYIEIQEENKAASQQKTNFACIKDILTKKEEK